ncbi:hypothetical protein P3342_000042 [Pyrenophora teres f. teres]|nr:hypothetical protein P3342_000042 [Pyrenophora teres f. teres]
MATNRTKAKTKTKRKQRGRPFRPANHHATKNKKRKDPRTGPRPTRGPNGIKLKQQQYYKFTSDIRIYHYSAPTSPCTRSRLSSNDAPTATSPPS